MQKAIEWRAEPWIKNFGVVAENPGFVYIIEHQKRFKIGRSKSRDSRLREAKTWLPDMNVIGVKPFWNACDAERCIHIGMASCWYKGEWYDEVDEGYRQILVDDFIAFSDTDINRNSVDFIYWMNGSGMSEFLAEISKQDLSKRKFLMQEASVGREES